jgi:hypothetical protein
MAGDKTFLPARFDPFGQAPDSQISSGLWMWATTAQAVLTTLLLIVAKYGEGLPWEKHINLILCLGIIATWSLALRTIRERLVELMRYWHAASKGLLRKASQSGLHFIPVPLAQRQETYIKQSIRRLRIIAAGITIPFFVMPLTWTFVSAFASYSMDLTALREYWAGAAMFMLLCATIVAGYFHWVILPKPAPVRVSGLQRPSFPARSRRS